MTLSASDVSDAFLETVMLITDTDDEHKAMAVLNSWKMDPAQLTMHRSWQLLNLARTVLSLELERTDDEECSDIKAPVLLTEAMAMDYERRAAAERAEGGSCRINYGLPTVAVTLADGSTYFFQEHEASNLLDEVPDNISSEDYILALAQGW